MSDPPQDLWTAVDAYIDDQLVGHDAVLTAAIESSAAARLPTISVSPSQGKLLFVLAKTMGARRILELGTLGGFSAIWLARALPADGRLITIEADAHHAEVARRNFARAGVTARVDLRVGRGLDVLPQLQAERSGPFDFVFIDADKVNYPHYLDWAIRLGRPGSLIVADNIVRKGAVIDAKSEDAAVQAMRRMMAALRTDPRVTATAIQTVGVKGYDGFAMVLVN